MAPRQHDNRAAPAGLRSQNKLMLKSQKQSLASSEWFPSSEFSTTVPIISTALNRLNAGKRFFRSPPQASQLVQTQSTRSAVAKNHRPLRDLDFRDHAAADPSEDRTPILRTFLEPFSHCRSLGASAARSRLTCLGRA